MLAHVHACVCVYVYVHTINQVLCLDAVFGQFSISASFPLSLPFLSFSPLTVSALSSPKLFVFFLSRSPFAC